eukprot:m.350712 g.350712  ORF g.350712 m.350712 type:complete len:188 (+) comp16159_c0_seq2:3296-3859(+)
MRDATHLEATQDELQDLTRELIAGHINEAVVASTGDGEQGHAPGTQGADTDAGPHTAVGEGDQDSSRSVLYLYDKGLTNTHVCSQYNVFLLTPQRKLYRQLAWSTEASRKTRTVSQYRTVVENVFGELKSYGVIGKPVSINRAQLADIEMEVARIFVNLRAERSLPEECADIFKYCALMDEHAPTQP